MRTLATDLRYALRTLAKAPLFTGVAVLSLALGIGANTAIFTLIDQVLLRRLPIHDPQQLVLLSWNGSHYGSNTGWNALSYPMYRDFRDRNQVFSGVLCRYGLPLSLGYQGQTERVAGELVSGNYFQVLGVGAAIGRVFTPEDDRVPSGEPFAVLSYDFWVNRFASDPEIVGRTIMVNGYPLTVIGVSQPGFYGVEVGSSPKIRVPVMMKREMAPGFWWKTYNLENRRARWVNVFARLKPGVGMEQAKASLQPLFHSILEMEVRQKEFAHATAYVKEHFLKSSMDVMPAARGRSYLRLRFSTPLLVLMCIVGVVLLIACANVANLLLARAAGRQREIAVRMALGAGVRRILQQALVESILLAAAGGAAGLAVAAWSDRLLLRFIPQGDSPLNLSTTPDLRILAFTAAVSLVTGIVFGLAPALQSARVNIAPTLKEQAGAVVGGPGGRFRQSLVIAQVFLSVLLLIGAGLFVRTLRNLQTLNPGFHTRNVLTFGVDPPLNGYTKEHTFQFYRGLLERLRGTPAVDSAGLGLVRVIDGDEWDNSIAVEGHEPKPGENMNPFFNAASTGYFSTLGIPILEGRDFNSLDDSSDQKVAIVNRKFERRYFGSRSAVGRHLGFGSDPGTKTDVEIVGVIQNAKYQNMREDVREQVFVPALQMDNAFGMNVYLKTSMDADQMAPVIRRLMHNLDPNLPVFAMRTLEVQMDRSLATERLVASLAGVFGFLATLLAAIGLYGLMAHNVARRTREIGIRMALGAAHTNVTWMVMREVLLLISIGTALALPVSWFLTRLVKSQLFGITPNDPGTLAAAAGCLALIAMAAGFLPARRAARIDPIQALRYE